MLRAVSQVFFFFEDKLRQCQPVSNLHCSFFLPLKYEIIHCVANCWEEGTNTTWNTLNTDLERDSVAEESLEAGCILAFLDNAVINGIWVEAKLLFHVLRARAMTSTGAAMVCNGFSTINHIFSWIWLAELCSTFSNLTSFSGRSSSSFPPLG